MFWFQFWPIVSWWAGEILVHHLFVIGISHLLRVEGRGSSFVEQYYRGFPGSSCISSGYHPPGTVDSPVALQRAAAGPVHA